MSKWISVKDRLPDIGTEVLVYDGTDIVQAYVGIHKGIKRWVGSRNVTDSMADGYVQDRTICKIGDTFDFITHWMPLPEPPTE